MQLATIAPLYIVDAGSGASKDGQNMFAPCILTPAQVHTNIQEVFWNCRLPQYLAAVLLPRQWKR